MGSEVVGQEATRRDPFVSAGKTKVTQEADQEFCNLNTPRPFDHDIIMMSY